MSLINDALNRAKQAQQNNPPPPPDLPFRPADPSPPQSSGRPILLIVVVLVVLGLAALLVVLAWPKRGAERTVADAMQSEAPAVETITPSAEAPPTNPVPVVEPAFETPPPEPAPAVVPPPATVEPATPTNTPVVAATNDSPTNVTVAAADTTPPKPALPKLQGIFYRPERPSAVVSGKNVFIGSRVGEFHVLAITKESVTVGSATQTNVLSLGE